MGSRAARGLPRTRRCRLHCPNPAGTPGNAGGCGGCGGVSLLRCGAVYDWARRKCDRWCLYRLIDNKKQHDDTYRTFHLLPVQHGPAARFGRQNKQPFAIICNGVGDSGGSVGEYQPMALIELRNVSKIYQSHQYSVRDVNLSIQDGEFVIFLGPSGCGKSTTLRMIAGLESITSGELRINGQNVNRVAPRDRNIAVVFQSYALYPHMTVAENMAFGLKMRGTPTRVIQQKIAETAAMLGLDQLLHRKPAALSGGQRQRVALGRAIVREPQAFLLDEPLSNLDAQLRAEMRTELIKLHRRLGKTMIYVTHDQVEAMTMGDRICIMRDGYLVQSGKPLEVYANPVNIFVARFLSSPPINLLPCVVRA